MSGLFISVDGPGGVGKSTVANELAALLTAKGHRVHASAEPSTHVLGQLARRMSSELSGLPLACLVAADRYQHLKDEVVPRIEAGDIVVCDRFVASSLALQRMDTVPLDMILSLNAAVTRPALSVLLTAPPDVLFERISSRGVHSRFQGTLELSTTEAVYYEEAAEILEGLGWRCIRLDTSLLTPATVAALVAAQAESLASQ